MQSKGFPGAERHPNQFALFDIKMDDVRTFMFRVVAYCFAGGTEVERRPNAKVPFWAVRTRVFFIKHMGSESLGGSGQYRNICDCDAQPGNS